MSTPDIDRLRSGLEEVAAEDPTERLVQKLEVVLTDPDLAAKTGLLIKERFTFRNTEFSPNQLHRIANALSTGLRAASELPGGMDSIRESAEINRRIIK